jgi:ferredoxin
MSLFDAAEFIAESDRLSVNFDSQRCLHAISKLSNCEACFEICPVNAIQPGKPPNFEKGSCVNCMACIPACPVSAFSMIDAIPALLKCAARIRETTVELLCQRNSHPEAGPEISQMAIRVRGCLAGLGSSAYLGLTTLGKKEIILRLEDCDNCELGILKSRIHHQVTLAHNLISPQANQSITIIEDVENINLESRRTLWDADNPPLSRRDLFRLASQTEELALAKTLATNSDIQDQTPGRERLRMNAALKQLIDQDLIDQTFSHESFNYALLLVNSDCSACGVCARACPTGALHFNQKESHFQLEFSPLDCINCTICQNVCTEDAINIDHNPSINDVYKQDGLLMLIEGDLSRCARCGVMFSPKQDEAYCPICNYRVQHPFGSRMPPGFKSKNKT